MGINNLFNPENSSEYNNNGIENTYDFDTNNSSNKNKEDLLSNK